METDEELAARLRYITGEKAMPRDESLNTLAERYGLKRGPRRDWNYGTKLMVGVDPGAIDQALATLYSYEPQLKNAAKIKTIRQVHAGRHGRHDDGELW